jgi:hypothetical protein
LMPSSGSSSFPAFLVCWNDNAVGTGQKGSPGIWWTCRAPNGNAWPLKKYATGGDNIQFGIGSGRPSLCQVSVPQNGTALQGTTGDGGAANVVVSIPRLMMVWRGLEGSIWMSGFDPDNGSWDAQTKLPFGTGASPSICSSQAGVAMAWNGSGQDGIWFSRFTPSSQAS